jgi:SnoaL-like polyketide cyclase
MCPLLPEKDAMLDDAQRLRDFAKRYTAAWCSHNASSVAAFYSSAGSLTVNNGAPSIGRAAITAAAQDFMTAFPDLTVLMDGLEIQSGRAIYRWTLVGTNTGPGGTGKRVRISGYEQWQIASDGLIAESKGHFDSADYQR